MMGWLVHWTLAIYWITIALIAGSFLFSKEPSHGPDVAKPTASLINGKGTKLRKKKAGKNSVPYHSIAILSPADDAHGLNLDNSEVVEPIQMADDSL